MTRRWLTLYLLLCLTLGSAPIYAVATGTTALADNGNGNGNDKKDKDKEKEKAEEKDKDKGKGDDVVEPAAPYTVEVVCDSGEAASQTVCTFTGVAPEGAKKVGHIDLPAADVCATVLGGDAEYVDPDPNTGVTGYKSTGGGGVFSLILEGEVAPGGTSVYWFKTGDGVFPAPGPGLVCGPTSQPEAPATTAITVTGTLATPTTAEAAPTGGAVAVYAHACPVDAESAPTDWFSACRPGVAAVRFTLSPAGATQPEPASDGATGPGGEIRFEDLTPGTYQLDAPDAAWCHAESDNVNEHGDLVVAAGTEVSVWIFFCGSGTAA